MQVICFISDQGLGVDREEIRRFKGEILLHDPALPLQSFVVMTSCHDISKFLVNRGPSMGPDRKGFDTIHQRGCF